MLVCERRDADDGRELTRHDEPVDEYAQDDHLPPVPAPRNPLSTWRLSPAASLARSGGKEQWACN
jgi:hypothetical protein